MPRTLHLASLVLLLSLSACEEPSDSDASAPQPPPQPLQVGNQPQSHLGKAVHSAQGVKEQIQQRDRELQKQADALYGDSSSDSSDQPADPDTDSEEEPELR